MMRLDVCKTFVVCIRDMLLSEGDSGNVSYLLLARKTRRVERCMMVDAENCCC